jgi:epidermal growth factor receptor substrate 15
LDIIDLFLDDDDTPPALPPKPDQYQELKKENYALKSKTEGLLAQLKYQDEIQNKCDSLTREHDTLLAKIQEMEQFTSELLNERGSVAADFTSRIADMERVQSQLAQSKRHLDISTEENNRLTLRITDMEEAAHALSIRTMNEVEDFRKQIESLEQDNDHLRTRTQDMERSISQSQTSNSKSDIRELRILMRDVTRENEQLKKRLRDMEESTTRLLLSGSDRATMDDLKRDNNYLKLQVTEMEELTRQLQSSGEDSELRRMLEDITHENEDLKRQLQEMQRSIMQDQSTNRIEALQTEIVGLQAEIRRLNAQIEMASSSHPQEDSTVPPPAYDDAEFTSVQA